jgi:hypothetical protein
MRMHIYDHARARVHVSFRRSNAYAHTFDSSNSISPAKKGYVPSSSSGSATAAAPARHSVLVPQGTLQPTGVNSSFQHNEFLVYNEAQQRIRYILTFRA